MRRTTSGSEKGIVQRLFRLFWASFLSLSLVICLSPVTAFAKDECAAKPDDTTTELTEGLNAVQDGDESNSDIENALGASSSEETTSVSENTPTPVYASETPKQAASIVAVASIVGVDADANEQTWAPATSYALPQGATAADVSEAMIAEKHITADYGTGAYGFYLDTVTSPYDASQTLGFDAATGEYWQLFVNGEAASTGASGVVLSEGDVVTWCYSAWGDTLPGQIEASCSVVGIDAVGRTQVWAPAISYTLLDGSTAADLTEAMIVTKGLMADYGTGAYGFYLDTVTSPYDASQTLGFDAATGKYWQLFVNGEAASTGASGVVLSEGDVVTWCYSAWGDTLPDSSVSIDADAPRPSLDSAWSGYAGLATNNNAVCDAATPTNAVAEPAWVFDCKGEQAWALVSEPLVVGDNVLFAATKTAYCVDAKTGKVMKSADLVASIDYTCRPVYAEGLFIVPLLEGRLQALTADTLVTVWISDALPANSDGKQQSTSTLLYNDGYVYAATSIPVGNTSCGGSVYCVDVANGKIRWKNSNGDKGYYWSGAAVAGQYLFYAGDDGVLTVVNKGAGTIVDTLALGSSIRSSISARVANDVATLFFSSSDGVLHKVNALLDAAIGEILTETSNASVPFATSSTSTPTIVGGNVFVGGANADNTGVLSVIDMQSMRVKYSISAPAEVKSAPLVSTGIDGQTYAYFTTNAKPGGIYVYRLGDTSAKLLFAPTGASANYCMSSIAAASHGMLFYTNDSSNLFAIAGAANQLDPINPPENGPDDESAGSQAGTSSATAGINLGNRGVTNASTAAKDTVVLTDNQSTTVTTGSQALSGNEMPPQALVSSPWQFAGLGLGILGLLVAAFLFLYRPRKVG